MKQGKRAIRRPSYTSTARQLTGVRRSCDREREDGHADVIPIAPALAPYLLLRVSMRTVYGMCAQGRLGHVRLLNAIRVDPTALVSLLGAK